MYVRKHVLNNLASSEDVHAVMIHHTEEEVHTPALLGAVDTISVVLLSSLLKFCTQAVGLVAPRYALSLISECTPPPPPHTAPPSHHPPCPHTDISAPFPAPPHICPPPSLARAG